MTTLFALLLCGQESLDPFYKFPAGTRWTFDVRQGERRARLVLTLLDAGSDPIRLESRKKFMDGEEEESERPVEWSVRKGHLEWNAGSTVRLQPAGAKKGDRWESPLYPSEGEMTCGGTLECKVAGGTYRNALLLQGKAGPTEVDFHLVPGVGPVRIEERRDGKAHSTTELASFSLGGAVSIDLSSKYNAKLDKTWHPETHLSDTTNNDLGDLPSGHQVFAGTSFNAAGVLQLSGTSLARLGGAFPEKVEGIAVGRACAKLHFLHATGWYADDGTVIGKYVVTYADGDRKEISVAYGTDVRDWWFYPDEPLKASKSVVAWTGKNKATVAQGMSIRLFKSTWENPSPKAEIKSIDFVSAMTACAPFLVGITAEPAKE